MEKQLNLLTDDECSCTKCKPPVNVKTEKDLNKVPKPKEKPTKDAYSGWRP